MSAHVFEAEVLDGDVVGSLGCESRQPLASVADVVPQNAARAIATVDTQAMPESVHDIVRERPVVRRRSGSSLMR